MKSVLFASVLAVSAFQFGCVQVPKTIINIPTERGVIRVEAPKDSDLTGLKANFEKGTLTLDSYRARMSPDVISATGAAQAELLKAYTELANSMAQMGMHLFAASQGIPLVPLTPIAAPPVVAPQTNQVITAEQLNAAIERRAEAIARQRTEAAASAVATNAPPRHPRIPTGRTNAPPSAVSPNAPTNPK